ncbi:MAG: MFS transporter [Nitrospinota bacterium]
MNRSFYFSPRGWLILAAGFVLMGLGTGLSFSIGVFLKPLAGEFNWGRSEISLAYSVNMLMLGAFSFIAGAMSDRWGTRLVLLLGTLVLGLGTLLNSQISAVWQLSLFYGVLMGIGKAAFHSPLMAHVARSFHKRRGLAVGIVFAGTGIGLFVMAPLSRFLISQVGWRATFVILAAGFFILSLPAIWLFREKPGRALEADEDDSVIPAERSPVPGGDSTAAETFHWKNRSFWTICGLHYFDCICHSVPLVHVVAYASDRRMAPEHAAGVLGVVGLAAIVGRVVIPAFTDRIGARRGLLITLFVQTGMIPFLMVSKTLAMFYIFAVIFGFGWGGNSPMYPLLAREYFGVRRLGSIYGGTVMAASLGMAAGGYMGGLLFDISGSYQYSLLFSLTAGLISIALVPLLKPISKRERREPAFQVAPAVPALEL